MINPNLWDVRNTTPADWTGAGLSKSPIRRALMDKLMVWGEEFLDASISAFGFSQPQDSYKLLPPIRTLHSGIVDLPAGN
jgi:hypothetical protein